MGAWLERLASAPRPPLWLDDVEYSERLLAHGAVPWLDVAALVAWRRKAQSLLQSDVIPLAVGSLASAWVHAHPSLRAEMAAKRRATAPLRVLLAAEDLRSHVAAVLNALRVSSPQPLALVVPSPRRWLADAQLLASSDPSSADEDSVDSASVYLADFLRTFSESAVDVLLLEEDAASPPAEAREVGWYQSTINVARHYRWDIGLRTPTVLELQSAVDFFIGPGHALGVEVGPEFWSDGAPPAVRAGGFRYAAIPADADPQLVLERLAMLR